MSRPRFRLRSLMLGVAVVAMALAAVLWVGAAREANARALCQSNLRVIFLGLTNHNAMKDAFPPGTVGKSAIAPDQRLSWWVLLVRYIGQNENFLFDLDESWNGGANRIPMVRVESSDSPPITDPVDTFGLVQCPAHPHVANPNGACETDYIGIAGLGTDAPILPLNHPRAGIFGYDRQTRPQDVKDGLANTMMVVESAAANGPWTRGGPSTVRGLDPARTPYIGSGRQFGGTHRGGANVMFADGSVRFIPESINHRIFEAFSTVAGGEVVPTRRDD